MRGVEECSMRRRDEGRRAAAQDVDGGARVQGTAGVGVERGRNGGGEVRAVQEQR